MNHMISFLLRRRSVTAKMQPGSGPYHLEQIRPPASAFPTMVR